MNIEAEECYLKKLERNGKGCGEENIILNETKGKEVQKVWKSRKRNSKRRKDRNTVEEMCQW